MLQNGVAFDHGTTEHVAWSSKKLLARQRSQQQNKKGHKSLCQQKTRKYYSKEGERLRSDGATRVNSTILLCEDCIKQLDAHSNKSYFNVCLPILYNVNNALIHNKQIYCGQKNQCAPINLITWTKYVFGWKRKDRIPPSGWCIHEVPCQSQAKRLACHCDGWHRHIFI